LSFATIDRSLPLLAQLFVTDFTGRDIRAATREAPRQARHSRMAEKPYWENSFDGKKINVTYVL